MSLPPTASCDLNPLCGAKLILRVQVQTESWAHSLSQSPNTYCQKYFLLKRLTNVKPGMRQYDYVWIMVYHTFSHFLKIQSSVWKTESPIKYFQPFIPHISHLKERYTKKTTQRLRSWHHHVGPGRGHLDLSFILSFKWNVTQEYTRIYVKPYVCLNFIYNETATHVSLKQLCL